MDRKAEGMIKITVDEQKAGIEAEGRREDIILETGFALYQCIIALRQCEKSDKFIEGMFKIALEYKEETDD